MKSRDDREGRVNKMGILIKDGYVLNHRGEKVHMDILVEGEKIVAKGPHLNSEGHEVVDARGKLVLPGLIDMHVHLREPGFEAKETIATGTMAAAKGGFTTVACMPNTKPTLDTKEMVQLVKEKARKEGYVHVLPIGAITERQLGERLTDFGAMQEAGIIGVSDDGVGVQSSYIMKQAMRKAKEHGLPVIAHCEDNTLINGGAVHEGTFSAKYNVPGIPSVCESVQVARDILLAEATGVHYHVCHISTKESVRLVREAKKAGISVTAEVTPHHLLLCDEDIPGLDANYKMNPPLRSREDQEALLEGLLDGTIDIIATDHAPHTPEEKARDIRLAPFGIVGLETAFPLLYTHLVRTGKMSLAFLVEKLTSKPADLFGIPAGRLSVGSRADITIVDLEQEEAIDPESFVSKGRNTPFGSWICAGWPVVTMVSGAIVWSREQGFRLPNK